MRALFVVLLLGNLALLAWVLSQSGVGQALIASADSAGSSETSVAPEGQAAPKTDPSEQVLADGSPAVGDGTSQTGVADVQGEEIVVVGEVPNPDRVCEVLGPFIDAGRGKGILEELSVNGVTGKPSELDVPAPSDYWVYFPPLKSRRAAMKQLAEFQSKNIDSFVITQGALLHGVSLGLFTKKPSAVELVERMRTLGYPAKIQEVYRSRREFWINVEYIEGGVSKVGLWRDLESRFPLMQRRSEICK